jgi:molybdate transport system substrate-binding protein
MRRTFGLLLAYVLLGSGAQATELRVIVATPLTGIVHELGASFERASGHKLAATFVSGPVVKERIDRGERFDLAISITPVIDALIADGKLSRTTRADIGYAPVAVGVRAGAPKPSVETVEQFRDALLNAKSVAHSATGASGDHFKSLLVRLGIAEQIKPKLRPMPADRIAQAVPSGEAEMIVVTMPVIMVPGMDLVAPIPKELQFYNSFAGAVLSEAGEPAAAAEFLRVLNGPAAPRVMESKGMHPGKPPAL